MQPQFQEFNLSSAAGGAVTEPVTDFGDNPDWSADSVPRQGESDYIEGREAGLDAYNGRPEESGTNLGVELNINPEDYLQEIESRFGAGDWELIYEPAYIGKFNPETKEVLVNLEGREQDAAELLAQNGALDALNSFQERLQELTTAEVSFNAKLENNQTLCVGGYVLREAKLYSFVFAKKAEKADQEENLLSFKNLDLFDDDDAGDDACAQIQRLSPIISILNLNQPAAKTFSAAGRNAQTEIGNLFSFNFFNAKQAREEDKNPSTGNLFGFSLFRPEIKSPDVQTNTKPGLNHPRGASGTEQSPVSPIQEKQVKILGAPFKEREETAISENSILTLSLYEQTQDSKLDFKADDIEPEKPLTASLDRETESVIYNQIESNIDKTPEPWRAFLKQETVDVASAETVQEKLTTNADEVIRTSSQPVEFSDSKPAKDKPDETKTKGTKAERLTDFLPELLPAEPAKEVSQISFLPDAAEKTELPLAAIQLDLKEPGLQAELAEIELNTGIALTLDKPAEPVTQLEQNDFAIETAAAPQPLEASKVTAKPHLAKSNLEPRGKVEGLKTLDATTNKIELETANADELGLEAKTGISVITADEELSDIYYPESVLVQTEPWDDEQETLEIKAITHAVARALAEPRPAHQPAQAESLKSSAGPAKVELDGLETHKPLKTSFTSPAYERREVEPRGQARGSLGYRLSMLGGRNPTSVGLRRTGVRVNAGLNGKDVSRGSESGITIVMEKYGRQKAETSKQAQTEYPLPSGDKNPGLTPKNEPVSGQAPTVASNSSTGQAVETLNGAKAESAAEEVEQTGQAETKPSELDENKLMDAEPIIQTAANGAGAKADRQSFRKIGLSAADKDIMPVPVEELNEPQKVSAKGPEQRKILPVEPQKPEFARGQKKPSAVKTEKTENTSVLAEQRGEKQTTHRKSVPISPYGRSPAGMTSAGRSSRYLAEAGGKVVLQPDKMVKFETPKAPKPEIPIARNQKSEQPIHTQRKMGVETKTPAVLRPVAKIQQKTEPISGSAKTRPILSPNPSEQVKAFQVSAKPAAKAEFKSAAKVGNSLKRPAVLEILKRRLNGLNPIAEEDDLKAAETIPIKTFKPLRQAIAA